MLDEKVCALTEKYGIFEMTGVAPQFVKFPSHWKWIKQIVGVVRAAALLNNAMKKVDGKNVAVFGDVDGTKALFFWTFWYLLFPWYRKKIHYFVATRREQDVFHGRKILEVGEIEEYNINTVILLSPTSEWNAHLIGRNFKGHIIDIRMIISENHLEKYFFKWKEDPYANIFVERKRRSCSEDIEEKKDAHRRLIAYYIKIRDFLSTKKEIDLYEREGYEDYSKYRDFWLEIEQLFLEVKQSLSQRSERDVFIYWLDQLEKDDFLAMPWTGNLGKGKWLHRAYTAMCHTTMVMRAIFTGKNVKAGKLSNMGKMNTKNARLLHLGDKRWKIRVFSTPSWSKFDESVVPNWCKHLTSYSPATLGLWYSLDAVLSSSKPCVCLLHCMETHRPYTSPESDYFQFDGDSGKVFSMHQKMDFTEIARKSREYLDRQLEWHYSFLPPNATAIYMSDHGNEENLTEQNVNMPFKIMGRHIKAGVEDELFSYTDMYKLIESFVEKDGNLNECYTDCAVIDQIDIYEGKCWKNVRENEWNHFSFERKKVGKDYLKRYLQTTKLVTSQGEYYTINILGEETYYRDKECKENLVNDAAYVDRIALLREKAGKFYNPWKEKKQIAIAFYEYLGIKEKDILAQCY